MAKNPLEESDSEFFRRIADEAVKKAGEKKEGLNEVLGVLTGGALKQRSYGESLADSILGLALGAHTDLGKSDEAIILRCKELLGMIRRAKASPAVLAAIDNLRDTAR